MKRLDFDTIRSRIVLGLTSLALGLVITAAAGTTALRTMRQRITIEMDAVRTANAIGSGLLITVFDELRSAEQYLAVPDPRARTSFQDAADSAFAFEQRLDKLRQLCDAERSDLHRVIPRPQYIQPHNRRYQ